MRRLKTSSTESVGETCSWQVITSERTDVLNIAPNNNREKKRTFKEMTAQGTGLKCRTYYTQQHRTLVNAQSQHTKSQGTWLANETHRWMVLYLNIYNATLSGEPPVCWTREKTFFYETKKGGITRYEMRANRWRQHIPQRLGSGYVKNTQTNETVRKVVKKTKNWQKYEESRPKQKQ